MCSFSTAANAQASSQPHVNGSPTQLQPLPCLTALLPCKWHRKRQHGGEVLKPLLPRNTMHSLPDALSGQTWRKLSPPAICQDRGFKWAFGKDSKIRASAKKGDKRRLS